MMSRHLRVAGILLAFCQLGTIAADDKKRDDPSERSADWPLFRGNPLQTGVAGSDLPESLEIRWKFKGKDSTEDSIEATAAIVNGTVYYGSMDGHLYALSLATGKQKWRYKAAPIKAAPSVHGFAVYVGDTDGIFHCIERATGKKRWTFETAGEISSCANFAGEQPLFGSGDETLYCLTPDGKRQWQFKVPGGPVLASPAVVGERTFVSGCDSMLHVIDTSNGKELSSVELEGQTGATPAVVGDQLYVGTMGNQMLAVNWKKGQVLWRFEADQNSRPFLASAAVTDRLVIAASQDKQIHALDRQTGKEVWHFTTGGKVDSSPVVVGQRVFVGSQDGNLYVLDLNKGTELKKFNLGAPITASAAVAENCLVIGTQDGVLYCFGKN
jgi:outer membrane protein assembly factor BamB